MDTHVKRIPLIECFGPTLQGEGAVIGQQTWFLRFGLCDSRCTMCDSMHAVDPKQVRANAKWLTQSEIFDVLKSLRVTTAPNSTKWVTFSGGNPCIHDLEDLARLLREDQWKIAVETQGTFHPDWLQHTNVITISPKGPGMGEDTDLETLDIFIDKLGFYTYRANIKVVVFDARDLEFAKMLFERYAIVQDLNIPFYLSLGNPYPPGYYEEHHPEYTQHVMELIGRYQLLFDQIKNDPILSQMRFLPQWHVFVWGNAKGR